MYGAIITEAPDPGRDRSGVQTKLKWAAIGVAFGALVAALAAVALVSSGRIVAAQVATVPAVEVMPTPSLLATSIPYPLSFNAGNPLAFGTAACINTKPKYQCGMAGQSALDVHGNVVAPGVLEGQVFQAYANMQHACAQIECAGIVSETWYVVDMDEVWNQWSALSQQREDVLGMGLADVPVTLVQVSRLIKSDLLVTIEPHLALRKPPPA